MTDVSDAKSASKPKKNRIFYPVLFAIFPVLSVYSANLSLVPYLSVIRPVLVTAAVSLALWGILTLVIRSGNRAAVASSAIVAMCFMYSRLGGWVHYMYLPDSATIWVWFGLTLTATVALAVLWRWHKILNFLSAALVFAALGQIAFGFTASAARVTTHVVSSTAGTTSTDRPDIIYIILDGYGRSDALKRAMGFSNNFFIDGLKSRGFYIAEDAHSNYCQTELSVSSSLNMDFIQTLLPKVTPKDNDRGPLSNLLDHNAVARYLRDRGYIFAAITSGFPPLQFDSADVNMRSQSGLTLVESALVQMTPMAADRNAVDSMYDERRIDIQKAFESLESLTTPAAKPRFVMVHILAPHPPFVFGPNGELVPHRGPFGFWDGSDYMDQIGKPADYQKGYIGQAEYISNRMLKALDVLLGTKGPKPIILIQGDHGSKLRLDQATLDRTDVNECFPNLSAFLVPDSVRKNLYPGVTPVNSFRILFNGVFGDHLELRPDQSWYSSFPFPYDFTEITNRIATHDKMATVPVPQFPAR